MRDFERLFGLSGFHWELSAQFMETILQALASSKCLTEQIQWESRRLEKINTTAHLIY